MSRFPSLFVLALAITAALPAQALQPPAAISIGQVQGRSDRSAFDGRQVTVEAMVTADMRPGLGGIFVQDAGDGDPQTSDGLFIEVGPDLDLRPGQWLRIRGTVQSQGESVRARVTTLRDVQLQPLPARPAPPVTVLTGIPASWQALQGMQVRIEAPLTLSGQDQLGRYGELTVSFGGRLWQPSEVAVPGSSAYAEVVADNQRRRLRLDDGSTQRDPARVSYLPEAATLRTGMQLSGVQGIVDRRFDEGYRLQMTAPLTLPALQRPTVPTVPGAVRIAAFNLENFFNGDGRGGGFPTPRGAKSLAQFQAQEAKLVSTIRSLDADVAALMELENDGYGADSSIAHLVAALNAGQGKAGDWAFVDAGSGPGDNAIRVGIIYRSSRLTPIGRPAVLEQEPFGQRSRVPLAQAFRGRKGKPFVVVANHFKSKGCSEASGADVDQNDGQACWNATRTESARQLHQWLQGDPTHSGARDTVLLGDFNAYAKEDPIRQLEADGWRDAFAVAGVAHPYSYVYNGMSGRLDHALLNAGMARRLRGAVEWHINADEADDVGYHARNVPGPWRSSDHDPLLLGFSF